MGLFCLELSALPLSHLLVCCSPFKRIEYTTTLKAEEDIPLYVTNAVAMRRAHDMTEKLCAYSFIYIHSFFHFPPNDIRLRWLPADSLKDPKGRESSQPKKLKTTLMKKLRVAGLVL